MLPVIAHAIETVFLVTGVVMLIRCAFQYAYRTEKWHRLNVVLFNVQSLSSEEMKWWYAAMMSLMLGASVKFVSFIAQIGQ
ncbi:hypothetical protein A1OO_14525 [Enterovibrio norvegicus FF-33]|uniref:Uncharacterized protein n=1 Tax=Enterovibrio norvegicus FF-454 TaxID=1185651 RepID=A0A1E5CC02_9GAMM|nr:hypothetical protein A1OK_20945 [Enterovibrio norvegicus FF-454]OEE66977.1 hypothetical protein A1OO_14525 [Enterovibrio norvegicus FF-33]OEE75282.1 hypothetical protein A1OQ_07250 [Enterovibrio norvegicus FF-162]